MLWRGQVKKVMKTIIFNRLWQNNNEKLHKTCVPATWSKFPKLNKNTEKSHFHWIFFDQNLEKLSLDPPLKPHILGCSP